MNLTSIPPYWLNLILHATALGLIAWLAVLCLRHPRTRATAAGIGLLAIGLLPWLSALRTPEAPLPAVLKSPVQALPTWKITLQEAAPEAPAAVIPITSVEAPPSKSAALPTFRPWQILAALWLAGTSLCLLLDTRAALRLRAWRKSQARPTDAEWDTLAPLTRMGRRSVLLSDVSISPCVVGVFAPRLIIPRSLLGEAEHQPLRWALCHEAEHLRGHDLRWLAAFRLIRALFWWNPFVHRLIARWSEAREQICDLHATPTPEERASYSEFLIALSSRSTPMLPGTLAMADRGPVARLKRRLVFLLAGSMDRPVGKTFACAAIVLVLLNGILLPSFGREPVPPATADPAHQEKRILSWSHSVIGDRKGPKPTHFVPTTIRLIFSRKPIAQNGEILTQQAYDELLTQLAQDRANEIQLLPVVSTFEQLETDFSINRRNPANAPLPLTQQELDSDEPRRGQPFDYWTNPRPSFMGIVMNTSPTVDGERVHLRTRFAYAFLPGQPMRLDQLAEIPDIRWEDVRRKDAELNAALRPDEVAATTFGEIEPGRYLTIFTQCVAILDRPAPQPVSPAPFLRATGHLIDIAEGEEWPVLPVPLAPEMDTRHNRALEFIGHFSQEQTKAYLLKGRELPAVQLISGAKGMRIWNDEIPRFGLEATVKSDQSIGLTLNTATFPGKEPTVAVRTSLLIGDGTATLVALDPPPGIKRRLLHIQITIEKPAIEGGK